MSCQTVRRAWVAALGWLCLCSYFLVICHHLVVEHETCAAHGELVHSDHESHTSQKVDSPDTPINSVTPLPDGEHEHDHCWVCADRREFPPESIYEIESSPLTEVRDIATSLPPSFVRVLHIYAYAPKTSPPTDRG